MAQESCSNRFKVSYSLQDARRLVIWFVGFDVALVIVYVVIHILRLGIPWGPLRDLFDLDAEMSIPTWFSSVQLFIVAFVFFVISNINQLTGNLSKRFFLFLSLVFVFLSADEGGGIHERMTIAAIKLKLNWMLFRGDHGAWITVYSVIALLIMCLTGRHLLMMWRHYRHETLVLFYGAIIYAIGAVGFEVMHYSINSGGLILVEIACEEFFEMLGVSIILYGTLLLGLKNCIQSNMGTLNR